MKKIVISLLSLMLLIMFVSCEEAKLNLPEITTAGQLKDFASQQNEFAGVTEAAITQNITLTPEDQINFDQPGLTLVGNGGKLIINKVNNTPSGSSFSQILVNADTITFDGVEIEVTAELGTNSYYVIYVQDKDFVFKNGSIKGQVGNSLKLQYGEYQPETWNVMMGICFTTNTSGEVLNSTLTGCIAPISSTPIDIEINNVAIDGHIYIESKIDSGLPKIKDVKSTGETITDGDNTWKAHIDFLGEDSQDNVLAYLDENEVMLTWGKDFTTVEAVQ